MNTKYLLGAMFALATFVIIGCGTEEAEAPSEMTDTSSTAEVPAMSEAPGDKVNINTATEEDMLAIPNVGDRMVHEFEEYRPYISIQQFRREIGKYVDEEQVAAYEEYIYVPISPNDSDAETLMQIPGLDSAEAANLVEARPFASDQAFLDALSAYVTEGELAQAEVYLVAP